MINKTYYIKNSKKLDTALKTIEQKVPCFVNRELIEMDYSQVSISARQEDMIFVENTLAPLV